MLSQGIERKTRGWDTTSWDTLSSFLVKEEEKKKTEQSIRSKSGFKISFFVQDVWFQAICLMTLTAWRSRDSGLFFAANGNIVREPFNSQSLSFSMAYLFFVV